MVKEPPSRLADLPESDDLGFTASVKLREARSGSCQCALVAFYEDKPRLLHIAAVGNSRAVLGRRRPRTTTDGETRYDVHVLSADQTPDNAAEAHFARGGGLPRLALHPRLRGR
ncbi:hypothetical protein C8R46DRAFT_1299863 [Mycena filopes]|nr:hypothetical protein C8R46DRAFT_1299863 [Mycena filopes]